MSRTKAKKDLNQDDLVEFAESLPGVTVALTHQLGGGFPDVVLGCRGHALLGEIKNTEYSGKLTEKEQKFANEWRGPYRILKTEDDILDWYMWVMAQEISPYIVDIYE